MSSDVPHSAKSLPRRLLEKAIRGAFTRAYETVKVDPVSYLQHLRIAYELPAMTYEGVYSVDLAHLDYIAEDTIRASMKIAAAEGAGMGFGPRPVQRESTSVATWWRSG